MIATPIAAIRGVFLVNGLMMGSFAAHLPLLKARLDLPEGLLGVLLLAMSGGAVATMLVCGPALDRLGSRLGLTIAAILMALTLPWIGYAPSPALLFLLFALFGAGNGLMDVAMNAHGATIQQRSHRSIMSSLHGFFSLGGMLAAGGTALALGQGFDGGTILFGAIAAALALLLLVWPLLLRPDEEDLQSGGSPLAWPRGAAMPLALLALAAFIGEGAMYDWAAVFLSEVRLTDKATAAWGFGVFSAMMAITRFLSDRIIDHQGIRRVLAGSAAIALIGYALMLGPPYLASSLLGIALIGIGAANIIPILFAAAGRMKGRGAAIAAVATFGYGGALAGPAIVGFIAQATSLTVALAFPAMLLLVVLLGSGRVR